MTDTRPPAAACWTMLALVSLSLFGNYYVYDLSLIHI